MDPIFRALGEQAQHERRAYFTNTMTLGRFILMDFMRRKTRRVS